MLSTSFKLFLITVAFSVTLSSACARPQDDKKESSVATETTVTTVTTGAQSSDATTNANVTSVTSTTTMTPDGSGVSFINVCCF